MILPDIINLSAQQNPNDVAFIFKDKETTYKDLNEDILRCTQGLCDLGIKKGDTFGVVLRNSPEFIVLAMALSNCGAIIVPINFLEKPDRIALILNDAQAKGVLTAKEFYKSVSASVKKVPSLIHFYVRGDAYKEAKPFSELLSAPPWKNTSDVKESDLMMLLYTSGTTGLPKGVMLSHKNFLTNVEQCLKVIPLKSKDRFICLLPMFHAFAWTTCILVPLKSGKPIVIIESLLPFDPVIKAIWKHKVTIFLAVPQIYNALSQKIKGAKALFIRFLNPIRIAISGAAPLSATVHGTFEKTFGIPLLEGYGLTETSPVSSLNPINKRKPGTVGLPLAGSEISIRDDHGKILAVEEVGEIWIRGDHVMKGYYNKPNETKESITQDGWFKTGDMGKFDDEGYLSIVDRKKDLIIVKGLNVYPQEVEAVISQHPSINEVAVVGKLDEENGEESIRAFVTLKEGETFNKSDILALCRNQLAAYKRPKEIILLDEMPKNALQKILKKELRQRD